MNNPQDFPGRAFPGRAGAAILPRFLDFGGGARFSILHRPTGAATGAMVFIHPFAEEMNKARRMAALQARALAGQGWQVLQLDLFGCGDSSGDFGDASWEDWVADIVGAARWLGDETGLPITLWGLRSGCLLATEAAARLPATPDLLFWQPAVSGRQILQQFLRLKVAGQMLAGVEDGRSGVAELRDGLLQGRAVEVAGYLISPGLARGLDAARLEPPKGGTGRLVWLDLVSVAADSHSPASAKAIASWREAGWRVSSAVLAGTPFWQAQEIEVVPGLLQETLARLGRTP